MDLNNGQLSFGHVQDTGEHLPVPAITNMVNELDQQYQINDNQLQQVQDDSVSRFKFKEIRIASFVRQDSLDKDRVVLVD